VSWVPNGFTPIPGGFRLGPSGLSGQTPLVLLPGIEGDARVFVRQLPLAQKRRVFAFHLPVGFHTLPEVAQTILDRLTAPRVALFGASLGGLVGWAMSELAPARVAALMTLGTLPAKPFQPRSTGRAILPLKWLPAGVFRSLYRARVQRRLREEGVEEALAAQLLGCLPSQRALADRLEMVRGWALCRPPQVPTFWMRGQFEREAPWSTAQARDALPDAFVETVPGGHRAHLTHPTALHSLMEHFLKGCR